MLTLQIGAVFFIMDGSESRIKLGCVVGGLGYRHSRFAVFFGKKAHCRVTKSRDLDRASVSRVDRGRFAAGDHTAILFNEYSAFPMLTAAETVGRSSVCHFGFRSAEYRCAEREFQMRVGSGVCIVNREKQTVVVSHDTDGGGLDARLFFGKGDLISPR